MIIDPSIILTWVLFLALFPMVFFWSRNAWKIFFNKDYSHVALKKGQSPINPKKWAPFAGAINFIAALVALWTIIGIVVLGYPYSQWSAMAGVTIWCKIFADWILRSQAHPFVFGKKKKEAMAN